MKEFPDKPARIISAGFSRGINLESSFQVEIGENASHIHPALINDITFEELKILGCDVVRVPMSFDRFVGNAPDYTFQPEFWTQLEKLLDLGDKHDIAIIIDNHSWNLTETFATDHARAFMEKTWTQIAEFCKDRSSNIVFELKNSPDGDYWKQNWATVQEDLIKVIRTIDQTHAIIVSPAEGNSIESLPVYEDSNIIYTTHFYKPFIFTHQGLGKYGLGETGGTVSFPYDTSRPLVEPEGISADYKTMYASYSEQGTISYIERELTREINMVKERKAKMFVGEFGCVAFTGIPDSERAKWYEVVRKCLDRNNVAWTVSSYTKDFSIFVKNEEFPDFYRDLNLSVIQALGFPVPPGYDGLEDVKLIFGNQWGTGITTYFSPGPEGIIEVRDGQAYRGSHAIYWKIGTISDIRITVGFPELFDLSSGVSDYIIEFAIKHSGRVGNRIQVFIWDRHIPGSSWRKEYGEDLSTSNEYVIMQIPLSAFADGWGLVEGEWKDPSLSQFDWRYVSHIDLTVEQGNWNGEMAGEELWIDEIAIRKVR